MQRTITHSGASKDRKKMGFTIESSKVRLTHKKFPESTTSAETQEESRPLGEERNPSWEGSGLASAWAEKAGGQG